jgi:restriction endonuclease Mrr
MSFSLQSGRTFEETVETLFCFMGYHTKPKTVLHTRPTHIHAVMHHPKGTQKLLIECKNNKETIGIREVQHFCSKVAFARENSEVDAGLLISNTGFSEEAVSWCERNCSFVQLKTYKQLIARSANFRKMLRKFHK